MGIFGMNWLMMTPLAGIVAFPSLVSILLLNPTLSYFIVLLVAIPSEQLSILVSFPPDADMVTLAESPYNPLFPDEL